MARFDVYKNPDNAGYLLDVQADLLNHLNTRMVVPLLPLESAPIPAGTLNPTMEIDGITCSMVTQFMAAVPMPILKTRQSNLEHRRNEITAALDLLFQGF